MHLARGCGCPGMRMSEGVGVCVWVSRGLARACTPPGRPLKWVVRILPKYFSRSVIFLSKFSVLIHCLIYLSLKCQQLTFPSLFSKTKSLWKRLFEHKEWQIFGPYKKLTLQRFVKFTEFTEISFHSGKTPILFAIVRFKPELFYLIRNNSFLLPNVLSNFRRMSSGNFVRIDPNETITTPSLDDCNNISKSEQNEKAKSLLIKHI